MYPELALRFISGGSLIVIVTLLARTKYPMLAGIFMLFPAVMLVGYYFIGQSMSVAQLRQVTKFSTATAMWFVASGALMGVTQS